MRRADILSSVYRAIIDRRDEFAALIVAEMGKPLAEAQGEVDYGAGFFRWFAESAGRLHLEGQFGVEPNGQYRIAVSKRPVGPCLLITPWNFPLAMGARKIAPALAAGCTVVLKPAEQTPLTSLLLARVLEDSGVPAGVVNVITTSNSPDVIAAMMHDPRARKISFTGSTEVGKALLRQAAENVMNTSMELGGNAPVIIFEDADLDEAIAGAMVAKLRNGGESCIAANRIYVQRSVAADFVRRFSEKMVATRIGDGSDPTSELGPLIDDRQLAKVASLVSDAVRKGAVCAVGGASVDGPGYFYQPTVLLNVPSERPDPNRRDLRAGSRHLRIRFRRRSRQGSEQHTLRPGFIRVHPGPEAGPSCRGCTGRRHDRYQPRSGQQPGRTVRRRSIRFRT